MVVGWWWFVSLTHRPPLPPGNTPGTHFCWRLSRPQGHSAIGMILRQWKISMTPAGIEPATYRFIAQHLNGCATAVHKNTLPRIKSCNIYWRCVCEHGHGQTECHGWIAVTLASYLWGPGFKSWPQTSSSDCVFMWFFPHYLQTDASMASQVTSLFLSHNFIFVFH